MYCSKQSITTHSGYVMLTFLTLFNIQFQTRYIFLHFLQSHSGHFSVQVNLLVSPEQDGREITAPFCNVNLDLFCRLFAVLCRAESQHSTQTAGQIRTVIIRGTGTCLAPCTGTP